MTNPGKKTPYLTKLLCLMLVWSVEGVVAKKSGDEADGMFAKLHAQYSELSPKGKLATGAAVGFVGSRLALGTVTKVIKIGAGVFVAAEALKMTGIMEDIPSLSDEQNDLLTKVKGRVLRETEGFRMQVRKSLTQESVKAFFDKERMCALGVAGGAIAGSLL